MWHLFGIFKTFLLAFSHYRNEVSTLEKEVQLMQQRLQKIVSQRNKLRCGYAFVCLC